MKKTLLFLAVFAAGFGFAEDGFLSQPPGIKIGQRMTLRPYVSFSFSYDSNPDTSHSRYSGTMYWTANPGLSLDYAGSNWKLTGQVYYNYHSYTGNNNRNSDLNNHSYGEQLSYNWSNISNGGKGWSLILSERYVRVNQNDDFTHEFGRGIWRNRQQFDATGVLQRRFNEYWHASANAGFYWLDYANDPGTYAPLYSWDRWTAGLQLGFTASKWTDIFVSGSYQSYEQDCSNVVGRNSEGWTVHLGLGSYMTDRISYRVSGGLSTFTYGTNVATVNGFTYQGSLRWKIGETWMTSLLFSSHYQPSEREYASAVRCDTASWGLAKSLVRGKLNATFDIAYRRDTHVHSSTNSSDWDLNLLTARLGLNYTVNRLLTVFVRGEFQDEINEGDTIQSHYDYQRWRATTGLKFTY